MMRRIAWSCLALVAVGGCGIKEEIYHKDVNALKGQITELEGRQGTLISEKTRLADELMALDKEKGSLSSELRKQIDKVEEMRQMAEKRKAKMRELKDKLAAMQAQGKLQVTTRGGRMIVKNVLFDVGKSKLKPGGEAAIAQLTPILATLEGRQFQVAGHTDSTGTDETNWKLSANRALEVTLFMINQGMPPDRLSAAGYGRFAPVASNDTDDGKAQNRRIEIVLQPNIEELMGFGDD
jgi:chemotaxis protein MotB